MSSTLSVAKTLCHISGWTLSNLSLQKMLYMASLYHLGKNKAPLIDGRFEAWDYGPVEPTLYKKVKIFSNDAVEDVFYGVCLIEEGTLEFESINYIYNNLKDRSPSQLVGITHWSRGAWAKVYDPRVNTMPISEEDMLEEYNARASR